MSLLPNIFVDPALHARQAQLDAQWSSVNGTINSCDDFPSAAWVEFVNDLKAWRDFYASGSDYTSGSKHATDEWQAKLQRWTQEAGNYCNNPTSSTDSYIPGVKDPPPDPPESTWLKDIYNEAKKDVSAPFDWVEGLALKIGIGIGVLVLIVVVSLVYVLTRGKFEGYGAKVG